MTSPCPPGTCECAPHKPCLPRCGERHPDRRDLRCSRFRGHGGSDHIAKVLGGAVSWPKKKKNLLVDEHQEAPASAGDSARDAVADDDWWQRGWLAGAEAAAKFVDDNPGAPDRKCAAINLDSLAGEIRALRPPRDGKEK